MLCACASAYESVSHIWNYVRYANKKHVKLLKYVQKHTKECQSMQKYANVTYMQYYQKLSKIMQK